MKVSKHLVYAASAVLLTGAVTVGSTHADATTYFSGDHIALEVGPDGIPQVARYDAVGTVVLAIDLDLSAKCEVLNLHAPTARVPLAVDLLLDISADGDDGKRIFLVDNGFGTGTRAGCNSGNGQIADGHYITYGAGSQVLAEGAAFLSTTANVEAKFAADLDWWTDTAPTPNRVDLAVASDNGPDSANNDNTLVPIAPAEPFTAVSFAPYSADLRGAISVETGGDGAAATMQTVFHLGKGYEFTVDCSDQNTVAEQAPANVDSIQHAEFVRLPNGPKTPGCDELIGVTVSFAADDEYENGQPRDTVIVDHTTTGTSGAFQDVRARVTITWVVNRLDSAGDPRSQADLDLELARSVEYPGAVAVPVTYCTSYTGTAASLYDTAAPGDAGHPAEQPWCLLQDNRIVDGDQIIQVQVLDVYGDPKFF